jgi:hypothetical protein
MSNPTTPFSWQMPTATDLVTDLPADFEVFGQAVATSMADLLGGTTGQVLSKTTNADMDFTWINQDDSNAIQNAIVDAKGDLIAATAADTPARLAVGTNGQILTADSTAATGIKWATPAGGGKVLQVVSTVATTSVSNSNSTLYVDTGLMATITPTSATSKILAIFNHQSIFRTSVADQMLMRFFRGATMIYETSLMYLPISIGAGMEGTCILVHMDSPATTSATTYKTQFRPSGSAACTVQSSNFPSSLTLLEIGA